MCVVPGLDVRGVSVVRGVGRGVVRVGDGRWLGGVGEVGEAVLEVAARMVHRLGGQLNRVPERHRQVILHQLGVRPVAAAPARAEMVWQLTEPLEREWVVPAGVEVSTSAEGGGEPVVFATERSHVFTPVRLRMAGIGSLIREDVHTPVRSMRQMRAQMNQLAFEPREALVLALSTPVPWRELVIHLDWTTTLPGGGWAALRWRAWTGSQWADCGPVDPEEAAAGQIRLAIPGAHTPVTVPAPQGGFLYDVGLIHASPWIGDFATDAVLPLPLDGIAIDPVRSVRLPVLQGELVRGEVLGVSTGLPGQRFRLLRPPLPGRTGVIEAEAQGRVVAFTEVASFARSAPAMRHFTACPLTGEVTFGGGSCEQPGRIPQAGALLRVPLYTTGGGVCGNVPSRAITVLREPHPAVAEVSNPLPAVGGCDRQSLQDALALTPPRLPGPLRAVTAAEHEHLALHCGAGVARAHYTTRPSLGGFPGPSPSVADWDPKEDDYPWTGPGDSTGTPAPEPGEQAPASWPDLDPDPRTGRQDESPPQDGPDDHPQSDGQEPDGGEGPNVPGLDGKAGRAVRGGPEEKESPESPGDGARDGRPGTWGRLARLAVIPAVMAGPGHRYTRAQLCPTPTFCTAVEEHLRPHCRAEVRLSVTPFPLVAVLVRARVRVSEELPPRLHDAVAARAVEALHRYFNPLTGGPHHTGWPLGRRVEAGEARQVLLSVPDVDTVTDLTLHPCVDDSVLGARTLSPTPSITVPPGAVVYSMEHTVTASPAPAIAPYPETTLTL